MTLRPKQRLRAVIYVRVSLDATGEGRSNERQLNHCQKLADYRDYVVVKVVTDNSVSAYGNKKRKGWQEVLRMVEAGEIDVVVSWHFDRMTRSMVELERLILLADQYGVGVVTVAGDIDLTSDMGRMIARILAAVARAEVERKSARQKSANEQKAAGGEPWTGGARPFGYGADQKTLDEDEAVAIMDGAAMALAGVSMGEVARQWEARGLHSSRARTEERPMKSDPDVILPPTKGGWSARGVKAVLVSPRYAGLRQYKGEIVGQGNWPAILDMETHLALRAKLNDPARNYGDKRGGSTPENLLSTIATCHICGGGAVAGSYTRKRERYPTYTCRPAQHIQADRAAADAEVEEWMVAFLSSPDARRHMAQATGGDALAKMQRELDGIKEKLNELVTLYNADVLTAEQLSTGTRSLREREKALEAELARSGADRAVRGLSVGTRKVAGEWEALSLEQKRRLIETFLDIEIMPVVDGLRIDWDVERHLKIAFKNAKSPQLA